MKHVFTLTIALVIGFAASAQTEMGSWLVGGDFDLNTSSNNTSFAITPTLGYFIANNFAAGAMFTFDYDKVGSTKVTSFGLGPFLRYYFGTANVRPLLHGQLGYLSSKTKIGEASSTSNGLNYFLGGGLAAFINRNVALEALAGYDHFKIRNGSGSGGFKLSAGFQVYLSGDQVARATGN